MSEVDAFFNAPPDTGLVHNGRYRIKHPITREFEDWQRASNYAAPLDDGYGIAVYRIRQVLLGLSRRPDLVDLVSAFTPTMYDELTPEQKKTLRYITEQAETAAESDAKANRGTAVHEALTALDFGGTVPERFAIHANGYARELERNRLTAVAGEMTVLNVGARSAGKFDRVFRECDGTHVIGDIKTGSLQHALHSFAVQISIYATASHLVDQEGGVSPIPWNLSDDHAVLVHVDPDTGATSIYRVDLVLARRAANLAENVRQWRATKDVALPYVPPDAVDEPRGQGVTATQAANARTAGVELTPVAASIPVPRELVMDPTDAPTAEATQQAYVNNAALFNQNGTPIPAQPVSEHPDMADLMKLSKAELQRIAKSLGCTDLAHHRKWLAEEIVRRRGGTVVPAPTSAPAAPPAASGPEDTPHTLSMIAQAASVADLSRLREKIVQVGGDRAWTDEMAQVASARVAELDEGDRQATLAEIGSAASQEDLASIWARVTLSGTVGSKWTPELNAAAQARLQTIQQAAQQTATPANPFA